MAGESRGKLWRVRLVKTPAGYVGKETLIARLNMLTLDVAISARGDLYVCCHSGSPDWGTGHTGDGKIFKISYTDTKAPQPIGAWVSGPMKLHVAFDTPIDAAITNDVAGMRIEFGDYVSAADRLEVLKPPYQAVTRQEAAERGKLRAVDAAISVDNRTLTLITDPHPHERLLIKLQTGSGNDLGLHVDYSTESDPTHRPVPLNALFVPWAPPHQAAPVVEEKHLDLAGGDYERGRELFFG